MASPCWRRWARRLWSGLQNDAERGLGCPANVGEPGLAEHDRQLTFTGLRSESQPGFLCQRPWRADDRGHAVIGPPDRVQAVLEGVAGVRPPPVRRMPRVSLRRLPGCRLWSFVFPLFGAGPRWIYGGVCSQAWVERIRAEHGCHHGIPGSVAGTDARRPALTQSCHQPRTFRDQARAQRVSPGGRRPLTKTGQHDEPQGPQGDTGKGDHEHECRRSGE